MYSHLDIWLFGLLAIRTSDHPDIWSSGHLTNLDIWPSGLLTIRTSDHLDIRPSGLLAIWTSDHPDIWPFGLLTIQTSGHLSKCLVIGLFSFLALRLPQSQFPNVLPAILVWQKLLLWFEGAQSPRSRRRSHSCLVGRQRSDRHCLHGHWRHRLGSIVGSGSQIEKKRWVLKKTQQ